MYIIIISFLYCAALCIVMERSKMNRFIRGGRKKGGGSERGGREKGGQTGRRGGSDKGRERGERVSE